MWIVIGIISCLLTIVGLVSSIVMAIKHNNEWKTWLGIACISFLLCVGAVIIESPSERYPQPADSPVQEQKQDGNKDLTEQNKPVIHGKIPETKDSSNEPVKVHYIDVGQADSIYIELPNNNDILIDAGNKSDGPLVVEYLQDHKVDDIELLIATHSHEDHIGGIPDILDAFAVEEIIDSGHFTNSKICQQYKLKATGEGCPYHQDNYDSYKFGNSTLNILTGNQTWDDTNDYSVVCRLDTGDIEFLFTGDAETQVENILSGTLEAEILKVGHHGSNSSSSTAFLNKIHPEVAIISCGTGNKYGHPHQETLKKLEDIGAKVYRTDINGNIVISSDGSTYSVSTQKNTTAQQ